MLHRLILIVTKFLRSPSKRLCTVVKKIFGMSNGAKSKHEIRQSDSYLSVDIQAKMPTNEAMGKLMIVRTCSLKIRQYKCAQANIVYRTGLAIVWCYFHVIKNNKIF